MDATITTNYRHYHQVSPPPSLPSTAFTTKDSLNQNCWNVVEAVLGSDGGGGEAWNTETWIGLSDMDAVRVCLLLVVELVFMGKEDRNCIPMHLVSLVEDFDCWNIYGFWRLIQIAENGGRRRIMCYAVLLAWSNVAKFGKNDYNGLLGPDSNPKLELYATPLEQQTEWFKASIEYINGLVDLDMNVSEDDIGGDVSNNSFDLNENAVSGNGNNDVLLLEGGDGFVDSVSVLT
ncbi:hypothetical protein Tco_0822137 [Tanacetum coccineum]|uniref:Uncharacterized protein n=1 Tax=Tanacetum coccineum TaxID=301880 RepID=A0ABQ5AF58_9ASTR